MGRFNLIFERGDMHGTCLLAGFGACPPEFFLKNGAIWCVLEYILLQF